MTNFKKAVFPIKSYLFLVLCSMFFNIAVYSFMYFFHGHVSFEAFNYTYGATHFYQDPQIEHGPFNFLLSLAQYDAQWYLKIADAGYPTRSLMMNSGSNNAIYRLSFAFFPLYPLLIHCVNIIFKNIELSAFILSNLIYIADVCSLYFVLSTYYSESETLKTIILLFTFPFSIFYRSYFSEGISLFLLIWFVYFFLRKKSFFAAIFLGLLSVTRASAVILDSLFLFYLIRDSYQNRNFWNKALSSVIALILPLAAWLYFCYAQTGNALYFYTVRSVWDIPLPFLPNWSVGSPFIVRNILTFFFFLYLPFHYFHASKVEVFICVVIGLLLIMSRNVINNKLWWISFILWVTPLFVTDTMSFTRYEVISFPLFLFLAQRLKGYSYYLTVVIFTVLLFTVSLYFINWYWVG